MSNKFDRVKQKNRRKALMIKAGLSQAEVARKLHLRPGTVSGVLSGDRKSRRIIKYIARRLEMTVSEFWIDESKAA